MCNVSYMSGFKSAVLFVKHNIRVISIFYETMVLYSVGFDDILFLNDVNTPFNVFAMVTILRLIGEDSSHPVRYSRLVECTTVAIRGEVWMVVAEYDSILSRIGL